MHNFINQQYRIHNNNELLLLNHLTYTKMKCSTLKLVYHCLITKYVASIGKVLKTVSFLLKYIIG